jgi:hypothetical protein
MEVSYNNTMNGCSSGVFMIRGRSADPNVHIKTSAANNAPPVASRSQTKPGVFGYMSGTNCARRYSNLRKVAMAQLWLMFITN